MVSNTPSLAQDARMLGGLYLTLLTAVVRRLMGGKEVLRLPPHDPAIAKAPTGRDTTLVPTR